MELIFYDKAAKILEVTDSTLAHAVSRGELTRAGMQGNRRLLIEEQVMLFTGVNPRTGRKKRISYEGLSEQEKALWNHYACAVNSGSNAPSTLDIEKLIDQKIKEELARQEFELLEEQESKIAQRKEKIRPFLPREMLATA